MKLTIAGIGKIKEKWMRDGIQEYVTRLTPMAKVQILEQEEEKCRLLLRTPSRKR